jgi:hypothetical protein
MSALLNGGSRQRRRRVQGHTLLILIAITFVLLNTPGSTQGVAQQPTCGTDIVLYGSGTTALPSIDCETAEYKAIQKAQQDVRNQAAGISCPQECPTLVEVRPWPITCLECIPTQVNGYTRYYGSADVQGIYRCQ